MLKLEMVNAFGANFVQKDRHVTRSLLFLDAEQPIVIYPVGKHIGVRNLLKNTMTFLTQPESIKEITGMTFNSSRRYLAVHEKHVGDWHAWITIYDFKQINNPKQFPPINLSELVYGSLKNIEGPDKHSDEHDPQKFIVSLNFSKDNKYLAVLLSDQQRDTRALIYDWYSKNKLLYQYEFKGIDLVKISFNPRDWTQVCTSGNNHWKIWRLQEATFKQAPQFTKMNQNRDYTDHCWLDDDKLIVGTESGEIFFVDNFELKQPIDNAFNTGGYKQGPIGEDGK